VKLERNKKSSWKIILRQRFGPPWAVLSKNARKTRRKVIQPRKRVPGAPPNKKCSLLVFADDPGFQLSKAAAPDPRVLREGRSPYGHSVYPSPSEVIASVLQKIQR